MTVKVGYMALFFKNKCVETVDKSVSLFPLAADITTTMSTITLLVNRAGNRAAPDI